jgi:pimeloyl-ACP methyl ester carboxylesterase
VDATLAHFEAADGTRLAYHLLGSGPPVVCIPGGPGRASVYLEDLAGLAQTHQLVRLDQRGTGESELPIDRDSLTFPRLAEDIEELRLERDLDSMDLLAHSAGCFVALSYAAKHPDRLSRLVLVTPSGRGFGDVDDDVRSIRASRAGEPWYAEAAALEAEIAMLPAHKRDRPQPALRMFGYGRWDDRAQAHAASTDTQMSLRAMAAFGPGEGFDGVALREALSNVKAPVLVVVGRRDGLTGVRAGHVIADLLPDARVIELAEAGHFPWVDVPEKFGATLTEFLD